MEESDVVYSAHAGGDLLARLYRPAGPAKGAVVDVHGGAWTLGDRFMNAAIARHLADAGIAVLSLDFRLAPAAKYPLPVTDVAAGIRWLKSRASELGTTPEGVGLLGTSSGGHLALLAALRPFDERYGGAPEGSGKSIKVPYVVACWPVSDPAARYRMARERGLDRLVEAHHAFWADEAEMTEGSPYEILARCDHQRLPRLFVFQGTNDENVPDDMQRKFVDMYATRGGEPAACYAEGEPHGFITRDPAAPASVEALRLMVDFITSQVAHNAARAFLN